MRKIASLSLALVILVGTPVAAAARIGKELGGRALVVSNAGPAVTTPLTTQLLGPITYHDWAYTVAHWESLQRLNAHLVLVLDRSRPYSGVENMYGFHWPIAGNCIATFAKQREGAKGKWAVLISAPDQGWLADEVNRVAGLDRLPERPRYRFVTRYAIVGTGLEDLAKTFVAEDSAADYVWAPTSNPERALAAQQGRVLVVLVDRTRLGEVPEALRREIPLDLEGVASNEVAFKEWDRGGGALGIVIVAPTADVLQRAITDFASRRALGEARRELLDLRGVQVIRFEGPQGGASGRLAEGVLEGLRGMAAQHGGIDVSRVAHTGAAEVIARLRVIECSGRRRYWVDVSSRQIKETEGGKTKTRTIWTFEEWYQDEVSVYARLEFVDPKTGKVLLMTGAGDYASQGGLVRSERVEKEGTGRPSVPFATRGDTGVAEESFVARVAGAVGAPLPARMVNNIIWR